jgi:hypothetical protein
MALDLPQFLRRPLGPEQAAANVKRRLADREAQFLTMARRAIFNRPASPYARLLRAAGCDPGDLESLVAADGLEGALSRLADDGVYLTLDEFQGRRAAIRGSQRFIFSETEFDNPDIFPHVEAYTGGTRSPGTSVKMALPYFADEASKSMVALDAHGLSDYDHAFWLQGGAPALIYAGLGHAPLAWFHPVEPLSLRVRAVSWYMSAVARLAGGALPTPTFLDLRQPARLVDWLTERRREGRFVCVTTYASSAVRVCIAAWERGLRLDGVCFITLGEPFTEAKRQAVERVGARVLVRYAFTEGGIIGFACGTPNISDDLHFFSDCYGLIQRLQAVGNGGPMVDAFLFTSLLPTAPKIMLNVSSGDYGRLDVRDCGCAMGALGLRQHLSEIRSFEKLSGEGMTFVQTDLLHVLEEVLPSRFGGTSADYQALEEEGEHGFLRLLLAVSPSVGPIDEEALRETFLREVARVGEAESYMAQVWDQTGAVDVRRQPPVATRAGKILPFHLVQAPRESPDSLTSTSSSPEQGG